MRTVVALLLSVSVVSLAHAQGGAAMDTWLTSFATRDAHSRAISFEQFDKTVPAAARADTLVAIWSEAARRPNTELIRNSVLAYLTHQSVAALPWTDPLRAMVRSAASSGSVVMRQTAVAVMILRNGQVEMRDAIIAALDDPAEAVRDRAIGEIGRWPDHRAVLESYIKRNQGKKTHAATIDRARSLIQKGGIKK